MTSPAGSATVALELPNDGSSSTRGAVMAFCQMVDKPTHTDEQAKRLLAVLRESGPFPPEGARLVMAGPGDRGWRVVGVWDSEEAFERFYTERLTPAYADIGLSLDEIAIERFELNTLVAGDLTGTPEPAGV
jgi:hypothetical protein